MAAVGAGNFTHRSLLAPREDAKRGGPFGGGLPPAARAPAAWGPVSPRPFRYGAWYVPCSDWRVTIGDVSTWVRTASHLEHAAAHHHPDGPGGLLCSDAGGGRAAQGHRPFATLPTPLAAWTGRRAGAHHHGRAHAHAPHSAAASCAGSGAPASAADECSAAGGAAAGEPGGAAAALPTHSRWLRGSSSAGGGATNGGAAATSSSGGGGPGGSLASRAASVMMGNHVAQLERERQRSERAGARLAKQLAGSYGLKAYKGAFRACAHERAQACVHGVCAFVRVGVRGSDAFMTN